MPFQNVESVIHSNESAGYYEDKNFSILRFFSAQFLILAAWVVHLYSATKLK